MDGNQILKDYQTIVRLDLLTKGIKPKYPFQLNEKATYTQHQLTIYQGNYCRQETDPIKEQPAVTGGASVDVVLF